jgi:hypothetical protein
MPKIAGERRRVGNERQNWDSEAVLPPILPESLEPLEPLELRVAPRRYCTRWNGTLVTTVLGLNSSAPLMSSAR